MASTIFTLGYEKRSLEDFISILLEQEIDVLIDVRETAWSHKPGFSKTAFSEALEAAGIEYVHASFVGNPKYLRNAAPNHEDCLTLYACHLDGHWELVEQFDQLLATWISDRRRVCLTCFERHADDCHRSILADRWKSRGRRAVEHLAVDGCARLISA